MKTGDRLFLTTFISAIAIMFFFIQTSLSGYVISSTGLYCENGLCKGFCSFDEECQGGEACCLKIDFGICEKKSQCEKPYETNQLISKKMPDVDRPIPGKRNVLSVYITLTLTILVVGGFYSRCRHRIRK